MIRYFILIFTGISAGLFVAGGIFAFVTMIGVVQRIAARSKTAKHIRLYEDMAVLGGSVGNLLYLYEWFLPGGGVTLSLYGFFSGVYVGCLSFALAEVLNVLPVFSKRIKLTVGLPYIILIFALAKGLGAFYQMVLCSK